MFACISCAYALLVQVESAPSRGGRGTLGFGASLQQMPLLNTVCRLRTESTAPNEATDHPSAVALNKS